MRISTFVSALRGTFVGATMSSRSPGRFWFPPSYSGQGSSYVRWTTSLPILYIRNIMPDDMASLCWST